MFTAGNGGQLGFFEIAATVIPVLLFGGILVERVGPRPRDSTRRIGLYAVGVPLVGAAAVTAELLSIAAILIGPPPTFFVAIVAAVLVGGFSGVILAVWLPWMQQYRRRRPIEAKRLAVAASALLATVSLGTVYLIIEAVDSANSYERVEAEIHAQETCESQEDDFQTLLDRNEREQETARSRERAGMDQVADALERLTLAHVEAKPFSVIKLLEARLKREEGFLEIDGAANIRLIEQGTRLLKDRSRIFDCSVYSGG